MWPPWIATLAYLRCFMNFHDWILWWDKGLRRDELGENPCENPPRLQRFCDGALSKCGIQTIVNCKRQASLSIVYGRFVQNRWPRHAQTWFSWNQRANGIGTFVWSNWGLCPRLWDGSHSWVPSRQVTLTLVTSCKVLCKWIHLERKAKPFTACSILDTWWMNRLRFTCFTCFAHLHASRYVLDIRWTSLNRYAKVFPDAFETVQNSSTARRHEPSRLCIGKKCLHRGCQTARWFISRGFQKKGLKEFLPKDFLVQFVATFACLRKQAERHAERLGCWTSLTKTTNWTLLHCLKGEHFRWPSSPTLDLFLTHYWSIVSLCTSFASRQQRAREEKMWAKSLRDSSEYTSDYKANSLQHFPTNLKSCKICADCVS